MYPAFTIVEVASYDVIEHFHAVHLDRKHGGRPFGHLSGVQCDIGHCGLVPAYFVLPRAAGRGRGAGAAVFEHERGRGT